MNNENEEFKPDDLARFASNRVNDVFNIAQRIKNSRANSLQRGKKETDKNKKDSNNTTGDSKDKKEPNNNSIVDKKDNKNKKDKNNKKGTANAKKSPLIKKIRIYIIIGAIAFFALLLFVSIFYNLIFSISTTYSIEEDEAVTKLDNLSDEDLDDLDDFAEDAIGKKDEEYNDSSNNDPEDDIEQDNPSQSNNEQREYSYNPLNTTYEELDNIFSDYDECDEGIFNKLLNKFAALFNIDNVNNVCGLKSYINRIFDEKIIEMSSVGQQKTKADLPRGLLLSTLLYVYDAQSYEDSSEVVDLSRPLQVIVGLLKDKIITTDDIDIVLNQMVLRTYYPIFKFGEISSEESDDGVRTVTYGCAKQDKYDYYMDELKYHLFLRYGEKVSGIAIGENDTSNLEGYGYEYQYNLSNAWANTQPACKISGEAAKSFAQIQNSDSTIIYKLDENSVNNSINFFNSRGVVNDLSENIHMTKYLKMVTEETINVDDITINVDEVDYTYKNGFIFNKFMKFQTEEFVYRTFSTPRTIENTIDFIDSHAKSINSVLGYDNNKKDALYSSNGGYTCNYDLGLVKSGDNVANGNLSNIKVRLLFSDKANNNNMPIQGEELVDFEKYILGVTYAENEGGPFAALQAQSIAARSYALTRPSQHSKVTLEQENGVWILSIRNSNNDQVYCNPDTGCYACKNINTYVSANVEIEDSWGCGKTLWKDAIGPNEEIRSAVSSVAGKLLIDANTEKVKYTTYSNTKTQNWNEYARSDLDYVEILKKTYGDTSINDAHCESTGGSYATWKQYGSPWSNNKMGNSSETIGKVGCFATSIAINIARSGASLLIKDFNPGSFVDAVEEGFSNANFNRAWDYIATKVTPDFDSYEYEVLEGDIEKKTNRLTELINQGYYLVVRVQASPSQHWVAIDRIENGEIYMFDPGSSATVWSEKYTDLVSVYKLKFK